MCTFWLQMTIKERMALLQNAEERRFADYQTSLQEWGALNEVGSTCSCRSYSRTKLRGTSAKSRKMALRMEYSQRKGYVY